VAAIGERSVSQLRAELAHRPRGALHHPQHRGDQHQQQRRLAPQRVEEDLPCQRLAQLERLGHLDGGHAAAVLAGHRLQKHGHAHRLVAVGVVVEVDQRRIGPAVWQAAAPGGQVLEARDHLALEAADLEVHAAAVVGLEGLQRRVGHGGLHACRVAGAGDLQLFADRLGAGQQRAVVGGVGGAQRLPVQADGVGGDAQQQRHQQADQQLAAQRTRPQVHAPAFSR
jgi:hypothetical protein